MITRPVAAALGCRQCQSAIFRALLSQPASNVLRALPQRPATQLPILTRRFLSQERTLGSITEKDVSPTKDSEEAVPESNEASSADGDVPWFLEVEPPRHPESQHKVTLPTIPQDAPEFLEPMLKYIYEDMGLDDISLLDLRDLDPPAALGPNLIMLFGTTRSERHLHISSGRFVRWLKRNYDIAARADGLIGPGELRTKLRRLRKKAKLMGTNTAIIPGGDNGISTGWVCVNFGYSGTEGGESASFDESGRFSGFGAARTGTTIVVQCMTEARRNELDLESLWKGALKRSLQESKKVRGERQIDQAELDALLESKVQLPKTAATSHWEAMKAASQQHRYHSTLARRLSPATEARVSGDSPLLMNLQREQVRRRSEENQAPELDFDTIQGIVRDIQIMGTPFTEETLHSTIRAIFQSPSSREESLVTERVKLADDLLHTAEERGMKVWSTELFVTLIETITKSPSYGPELEKARDNFDHLMVSDGRPLNDEQIMRLMRAYAQTQDWDKFWDAFRMPSRFKMGRIPEVYQLAYETMALTGDQVMCIEALRWVYPEMQSEKPSILPFGPIYDALKACILTADPEAEAIRLNPPSMEETTIFAKRRLANREYLKLLKEIEAKRKEIMDAGGPGAMMQ